MIIVNLSIKFKFLESSLNFVFLHAWPDFAENAFCTMADLIGPGQTIETSMPLWLTSERRAEKYPWEKNMHKMIKGEVVNSASLETYRIV
jgi:hypothetical protein